MPEVRDNTVLHRYELDTEGGVAFATYRRQDGVVTFLHTETPRALRGRGIASALVHGALDLARAEGLKVRARCQFVADYLAEHPEFADLTP